LPVTVFRDFDRVAFASTNSSHRCLEEGHSCNRTSDILKMPEIAEGAPISPALDLHTLY
jgi:hypothetical protein